MRYSIDIKSGLVALLMIFFMQACQDSSFDMESDIIRIVNINPQTGQPGTPVTIQGTGFSSNPSENIITFNGKEADITTACFHFIKTIVPDSASTGPIQITIAGQTVTGPVFEVNITGTLELTVETSGPEQDLDGYIIIIDGKQWDSVYSNDTVRLIDLEEGYRNVELDDIAPNCSVGGLNPLVVEIIAGETVRASMEVSCEGAYINPIVFVSHRDENEDIFIMDGNGANQTNLTKNPSNDADFAISPDGSRIAFVSNRNGHNEIYIMNIDGSNPTRLTYNIGIEGSPVWSPDGSKLAFVSNLEGNPDIYTINSDGAGTSRLTDDSANDRHPAWSPDGNRIIFSSTRKGNGYKIFSINFDGSGLVLLTDFVLWAIHPDWSPDGTKIAFSSGNEIFVMNADGSDITNLTQDTYHNMFPKWSPDGTMLLFQSPRSHSIRPDICVINADGTKKRVFYNANAYEYNASWSPDGTEIVFAGTRDGFSEIYKIGVSGLGRYQLTRNNAYASNPVWVPR